MSLFEKLRNEFIDIVEWLEDGSPTLVWRFPRYQNEIKNKAQLTVREGQVAVFVNEGQIADVFQPGMYSLETKNLPILSTLKGWKYGFDSPFKAEVYFVATRRFTDLKWGTRNPVILRDADFGMVRLRAFGTFILQAKDPARIIREIVGSNGHFTVEGIEEQVRNLVSARFADVVGESKIAALDLASRYDEFGVLLQKSISSEMDGFGMECSQLTVENISLPEEVEKAIDKRGVMSAVGEKDYSRFQMANAVETAAHNPGSDASAGMGLGMGFAMAQQAMQQMQNAAPRPVTNSATPTGMAPPPLPGAPQPEWWVALDGQQNGPHTIASLASLAAAGRIGKDTLVWKQGLPAWTASQSVAELQQLFAAVPPPLPPAP